MRTDERLYQLLETWVAEAEAGRLLAVTDLCRNDPDLLPEAERQVEVLRRFHQLARPDSSTGVVLQTQVDTTDGRPAGELASGALPAPGARFGRYRIVAELGQGGMGIVCRAHDSQLDREVALKVMRPDQAARPGSAERFLREVRALAAVRHDHVVEVYDYGEIDGARFVAMPLLAGETLEARLRRQSPLLLAEVIRIGLELAEGLAAVHARGLIHRDLKPSNIWLEALHSPLSPAGRGVGGEGWRVKLLDFGLARDPDARDGVTRLGTVVGTPAYMSPEQANGGDLDGRSDLFSLGSVLYQAATGRSPFAAATMTATLAAVGEKDPPSARSVNPAVPAALSDLIQRLHRKNPADRPGSAAEVAAQLRTLKAVGETSTADWQRSAGSFSEGRIANPSCPPAPRRRRWAAWAGIAAGVLALFLGLGLAFSSLLRERPTERPVVNEAPPPPKAAAEPLRVRPLDVLHFENRDARKSNPLGPFGKESFGAALDDDIQVTARLSRPAWCYLIVFRPDGQDEVLYPQGADLVPEQTDEPRYPSRDRGKVYGLTDGTGLWLVALVASERPLPAYAEWRRQHPGGPWKREEGEPNKVWLDDGQWLEAVTPGRVLTRGLRGQKEAAGTSPIIRLVDWLKAETGGTVSAVAFTVEAKR